jgi:alpha-glucosidase
VDIGVAGIWNDMDEPSVFVPPTGTFPLDVVHDNDGQPTDHREIHNVYGQLMSRATFEGLSRLRPNDRAFVLTRASFAGGQRYAAVWPGDNTADWTSLRQSISTLLGMGLSGFPFVGCDISGFVRPASAELYTRWLQTGVFYPFMRSHTDLGTPDKEPWSFGYQFEPINRRTIELRYQLLPYIYNVMQQASETGLPAMRPLFLEYPDDPATATLDDQFLFGSDLLVAPVLWECVTQRVVYLPRGDWYDYWTGRRYTGGGTIHVPVALDSFPLFVRGGAFIYRQPVVQFTGQMPGKPLRVLVAPAGDSLSWFYEDDGESLGYRHGTFMKRRFHQARDENTVTLDVSAPQGSYRPRARDLVFELWSDREPRSVALHHDDSAGGDTPLPRLDAAALAKAPRGWAYADGLLTVKDQDPFAAERWTVQLPAAAGSGH